jgi:hypothetical protein
MHEKTFALAQALVFVHGTKAQDEAQRQRELFHGLNEPNVEAIWNEVAGLLPHSAPLKYQSALNQHPDF